MCALCWLGAAAPASAAPDPAFGANAQSLLEWNSFWAPPPAPSATPYLAALSADGVGVIRSDAAWVWEQPNSSSDPMNWTTLDGIVTELAQNHLRWQPTIDLAPSWAAQTPNTPAGCSPVEQRYLPPQDPTQYAAFAGALAARYGPGGTFWAANPSLPDLPVQRFEIWNEENVDAYWNNAPSATQYVAMYNDARTQIEDAVKPAQVQVIVGGVVWGGQVDCVAPTTNDSDYIEALFAAGGSGWTPDAIGVHPYGPAALNIVANLRREQQALQTVGHANVPLEQTELGWTVRPPDAPAGSLAAGYVDDASRAGTVALTSDIVMGSDCGVQSYDLYTAVERESTLVSEDPVGASAYDLLEHWTGIFALGATGSGPAPATMTSTAFAAAISRDQAGDNAGQDVPVCAPVGAAGRLLTLALSVAPTAQSGCYNATVTYLGLPVSGAEIRASAPIQAAGATSFGPTFTNPDGAVGFCAGVGVNPAVTAVVGGGSFDPSIVPLVASSNTVDVPGAQGSSGSTNTTTTTTTTHAVTTTPVPSPPPACVLSGVQVSRERLATALSRGLRARIRLATVAKERGCAVSLSLLLRPGGRVVGSLRLTVRRVGATLVVVRVDRAGRRQLRHRRGAVTLTLRLDVAGAPIGTGVLAERVRLRA